MSRGRWRERGGERKGGGGGRRGGGEEVLSHVSREYRPKIKKKNVEGTLVD